MKTRFVRFLVCLTCCGAAPMMARAEPTWIGNATDVFATDLYAKLASSNEDNFFFSPSSIQTALAMTYAGARGETADQMATALHLPPASETIHSDIGAFLKRLNSKTDADGKPRGYQLSVANALWGQKGYEFLPAFLNLLKSDYGAGLMTVDFEENSEGARQQINSWVEKQTADKIKNLIGSGVLTPATRLVLTNAIYFKGTWATQFDKTATKDEAFHMSAKEQKNVPMMQRTGYYGYTEGDDFQALELPYLGYDLSMIILLPNNADGLPQLEKELTPEKLSDALGRLDDQEVIASIPRFQMTQEFELGPVLESMGMKDAFGSDADFSGMTGSKGFLISNVIHKAFVEVNEQGTEAAAATGVAMAGAIARPAPPPVFRADHPFIFVIRDEASGAFLFMGRLVNPG